MPAWILEAARRINVDGNILTVFGISVDCCLFSSPVVTDFHGVQACDKVGPGFTPGIPRLGGSWESWPGEGAGSLSWLLLSAQAGISTRRKTLDFLDVMLHSV